MSTDIQRVVVTDVKMPFGSMIIFMIKWSIAAIPAFIILSFLGAAAFAMLGGFFTALLP